MNRITRRACALLAGVSLGAIMTGGFHQPASAQSATSDQPLPAVRVEAPVRKRAAAVRPSREHPRARAVRRAVTPPRTLATREPATTVPTKTEEPVINTLAAVSVLREEQINQAQPSRLSDIFMGMPGVYFAERGDNPASSINIRGLQDFGRVAVLVDGASQDFQRSGHFANNLFYVDPEMLGGVDVVRGPVANVYGSGAIGGVASFRTKDIGDILLPGEMAAVQTRGMFGTNGSEWLASTFMGARGTTGDILAGAVYRNSNDYREGNGDVVSNTGSTVESAMAKATLRPGEGQELKVGVLTYNTDYNFGQTSGSEGVYATAVQNHTGTVQYEFKRPDVPLVDFHGGAYINQTYTRQTVSTPFVISGIDFTGPPGTQSTYLLNTAGFEAHNTSRFDTGPFRHAITYGADMVADDVNVGVGFDPGAALTPDGRREAYGSFVEWKINYSSWLEVINAVRYDGFSLDGDNAPAETGSRFSPKTTIGITPITGFTPYFTYAEGYRAPSVTETFIAGFHPGGFFYFMPNPNLQPEVGKTTEAGVNLKYDSVLTPDDKFRAKINVFQNNVSNYIDFQQVFFDPTGAFTPPPLCVRTPFFYSDCFQYMNVGQARIEGVELDAKYDAGIIFAGVSGQHTRGRNVTSDAPLATIPPDQLSVLLGGRLFDKKLILAARWTAVAAKPLSQIPLEIGDSGPVPVFDPSPAYSLVNLYIGYQPIPEVTAAFSVENLLNVDYTKYMCCSTAAGYVVPSPGITFKGSLTVHYGVKDNNS